MDGIEMSSRIKEIEKDIPIIFTTAFSEVPYLLEAIKIGVSRYVQKPLKIKDLIETIHDVVLPKIQKEEIIELRSDLEASYSFIFGKSPGMKKISGIISAVAKTDLSVLLQGETGVGKSFMARRIHDISPRSDKPFITVDVATISKNLIESDLFGHVKGAFTGADKDKTGFFKKAAGGTLFIDELENIPTYIQAKLLKAIDERTIIPVGSVNEEKVDVRIVCATNIPVEELLKCSKLRKDLYYRLNEFAVTIPPLRERKEDIEKLVFTFLKDICGDLGREIKEVSKDAFKALRSYEWPGNIRELKNILQRAVLFSNGNTVKESDIKIYTAKDENIEALNKNEFKLSEVVARVEKQLIMDTLEKTGRKKLKTAEILGVDYKTLVKKIEKHGL
jgi:DNA-binding NtrC family response regulator